MKYKKIWPQRSIELAFVSATTLSLTIFGCGPEGTNSSNSTGSSSGGGGDGGSGGSTTVCLDATTHADILTIKDSGFCVVASFDVDYDPNAFIGNITWGRQGGIVFAESGMNGSIKTTRFFAGPTSTTGKLAGNSLDVPLQIPTGGFFGGFVLDLPFFNWSLASYTNNDMLFTGKIILFSGTDILLQYPINGFFSATAVGVGEPLGRLVYSGLSPIYKNATNVNGLYAADACGAEGMMPRLISEGDTTCTDSFAIEAFGMNSGPVAADTAGNVFTVLPISNTEQEAHGYAAETVKRGGGMTMGTKLFTMQGIGGSLAAVAPDGTGTGVLVFQPSVAMGMTFEYQEAIAQRFTIEGDKVVVQGTNGPFMSSPTKNTQLNFTSDDRGRIWVAIKRMTDYAVLVVERKT